MRTVYLSYDGLDDPLGQSQVLPYLLGLAQRGHRFHVISFEKRPSKIRVAEEIVPGVVWTALRYHSDRRCRRRSSTSPGGSRRRRRSTRSGAPS
jgi:hypothetical protein